MLPISPMNIPSAIQSRPARRRGLPLIAAALLAAPFASADAPLESPLVEWSLGFERAEGYEPGPLAASPTVLPAGGAAEIMRGEGAFAGEQWLRFEPTAPENGLFVVLPASMQGAVERSVRFQVRLAGDSPAARLVLARGETLAIRPIEGGIELEIPGASPRFYPIEGVGPSDWIDVELRERAGEDAWDLLAWGEVLKARIPLGSRSADLENILIFADGAIDLDALGATAVASNGEAREPATTDDASAGRGDLAGSGAKDGGGPPQPGLRDAGFFEIDLPEAIRKARDGKLAEAEDALSRRSGFERGSALWHFDQAQALSMVAFTLRQKGYNRASVAEAYEVLRHLELAGRKFAPGEHEQQQAEAAFLEAQVWDYLLADAGEARKAYVRALDKRPEHSGAQRAKARLDAPAEEFDRGPDPRARRQDADEASSVKPSAGDDRKGGAL